MLPFKVLDVIKCQPTLTWSTWSNASLACPSFFGGAAGEGKSVGSAWINAMAYSTTTEQINFYFLVLPKHDNYQVNAVFYFTTDSG